MTHPEITALRLAMKSMGYAPLPANGKKVLLPEWPTKGDVTDKDIMAWEVEFPQWRNTGGLCSRTPALDNDILQPDAAEAVDEALREWFDGRGVILTRFAGTAKRLTPFRTDTPFAK